MTTDAGREETRAVTIRLKQSVYDEAELVATASGVTMKAIVENAISHYVPQLLNGKPALKEVVDAIREYREWNREGRDDG